MTDRRQFLSDTAFGVAGAFLSTWAGRASAQGSAGTSSQAHESERFSHYLNDPVPYQKVTMQDRFLAPRPRNTQEITVQWVPSSHATAGGLHALERDPAGYQTQV